jgi:hypothetical protein
MYEQIVIFRPNKATLVESSTSTTVKHIVEPCLLPQQSQLLPFFPVVGWSSILSRHLSKRVRRNPRDLRAHVQRILLYISENDADSIYAALIDFFLILGNRGLNIRKNLLNKALPILDQEKIKFLLTHIDSGLDTSVPLPPNTFSSLSRGHSGTTYIVKCKNSKPDQTGTCPLEQATALIHQKDWLTAMVILEQALHHDPGDQDVTRELLSLYKRKHAQQAFYRTYAGLFGRCLALPQLWIDTESYFINSTYNKSTPTLS